MTARGRGARAWRRRLGAADEGDRLARFLGVGAFAALSSILDARFAPLTTTTPRRRMSSALPLARRRRRPGDPRLRVCASARGQGVGRFAHRPTPEKASVGGTRRAVRRSVVDSPIHRGLERGVVSETRGDAMPPPFGDYARRRYTRETLERMTLTDTVPLPPIARAHADKPAGRPGFRGSERGAVPTRAIPGGFDHRCDACGRAFANSHLLERHLATHRSEMPHACSTCDRRFSTLAALAAHRASHRAPASSSASSSASAPSTASRRILDGDADGFSCATCGRRFLDATAFVKHKMAHGRAEREEATRALRENGQPRRTERVPSRGAYPHEDAERRRAVSGVGASSKRRGPASRGYGGYAPREPEGTIWASAAANPRTKPRTFRSPATDARRVASGEKDARPSGDDARVSEDGFAPIASVSGYGSCAGSVTNEGDERRRGEDEDDERGGEDEDVARELPAETGHQQTDATKAEEEARRARAAAGKRARARLRAVQEAAAAAATAAAELSTGGGGGARRHGGIRGRGDGRGRGEIRGAPREGGGTRGGTRGAPTRVGRDERRGKFLRAARPRGVRLSPGERPRTPRRGGARYQRLAALSRRRRGRRRARGWARASARGGGSGGGISVASDAGMGRRVGGGGGWAAKEEPRSAAALAPRGVGAAGAGGPPGASGVGGPPGASGPGGPGAPAVARARRRSYRTRGGGESDGAGSEDE